MGRITSSRHGRTSTSKFDDGWDAYRDRVFARQKAIGWIPADTKLTPRPAEKAAEMKDWFSIEAARNQVFPVGGGLFIPINPSAMKSTGQTEWTFPAGIVRTPEPVAPNLKSRSNVVTVDAELGAQASGVLYALGGMSGGLTLYLDKGALVYEYNTLEIWRTKICSPQPIPVGHHIIDVETVMSSSKRSSPADIIFRLDGTELARGTVPVTVPLLFTATETFDIGTDLGSPVSLDYAEGAPFAFDGTIHQVHIKYTAPLSPSDIDVVVPDSEGGPIME